MPENVGNVINRMVRYWDDQLEGCDVRRPTIHHWGVLCGLYPELVLRWAVERLSAHTPLRNPSSAPAYYEACVRSVHREYLAANGLADDAPQAQPDEEDEDCIPTYKGKSANQRPIAVAKEPSSEVDEEDEDCIPTYRGKPAAQGPVASLKGTKDYGPADPQIPTGTPIVVTRESTTRQVQSDPLAGLRVLDPAERVAVLAETAAGLKPELATCSAVGVALSAGQPGGERRFGSGLNLSSARTAPTSLLLVGVRMPPPILNRAQDLFRFMRERHSIYLARRAGKPKPWTADPILRDWRFTNVFRELDATTIWMRDSITRPNEGAPPDLMLFNCGYFRFIGYRGGFDRGDLPCFITDFSAVRPQLKEGIARGLAAGQKVFTAAYKILDSGRSTPKEEYVVDMVLAALWAHRRNVSSTSSGLSLKKTFEALYPLRAMGGTGFMAYEIVSDLRWTSFYQATPRDVRTWANAGPGAIKGLNYLLERPRKSKLSQTEANQFMRQLLEAADDGLWPNNPDYPQLEMRDIEHSLCEFSKYERKRLGEGPIKSRYDGGADAGNPNDTDMHHHRSGLTNTGEDRLLFQDGENE